MGGKSRHYSSLRAKSAGKYARFVHTPRGWPIDRKIAALLNDHPALHEARTIYETRVYDPATVKNALVSGINTAKIGAMCKVGDWRNMPIFYVTLEERATCPTSCHNWDTCYGNALPVSIRLRYGPELITRLARDLDKKQRQFPQGFIVRLHQLGDFPDINYVRWWAHWLRTFPALRIYGYTAHQEGTILGDAIYALNYLFSGRVAIRTSVAPDASPSPWQATTSWTPLPSRSGKGWVVCPAEFPRPEGAITCGRCGLCWKQSAQDTMIIFYGHGLSTRVGKGNRSDSKYKLTTLPRQSPLVRFIPRPPRQHPEIRAAVDAAIAEGKLTRLPLRKQPHRRIQVRDRMWTPA